MFYLCVYIYKYSISTADISDVTISIFVFYLCEIIVYLSVS